MSFEDPTLVPEQLQEVAGLAAEVGLVLKNSIRVTSIPTKVRARLGEWLSQGRAGEMGYLEEREEDLIDPGHWKPWAQSMLIFAAPYRRPAGGFSGGGKIASYALGQDYHNVLGRRLERLGKRLRLNGLVSRYRGLSDAGPVLEREWALSSGLGFRGKNTLVLDPHGGSWQFLAELLVDVKLTEWKNKPTKTSCGSCTSCLDACPTNAFDEPWLLDPRKCISYLTIETKGTIPMELRKGMGEWVFGCDICQEVCPFGDASDDFSKEWGTLPVLHEWSLEDLLACSQTEFDRAFAGSPMRRPGWVAILRNACIALGNLGRGEEALSTALLHHAEPVVRAHAAWALGQLGTNSSLLRAQIDENDPDVREEISAAIASILP